jgi:Cysteine-rich secretory protein family
LKAFREQHELAVIPNPQWTGNRATCDPGDTSAEFKELILRRINYFRGMAGVPAVITFNPEYSRRDQAAALMISVNRQIVSPPPNTWRCYSAEGAEAFLASNLIINGYGPDAMRGYMRDAGASNGAVGHRRWLLYPQTRQMGTGDVPQSGADPYANALWIFDENLNAPRPQTRDTYVAWPPPGYVPYRVVFARWSFSHPGANFDQATVSVTANGTPVPISVETPVTGYGENTLVWIQTGMADNANWPKPAQDDWYQVTIQNVMIGANSVDFSYWVTIFDPDA